MSIWSLTFRYCVNMVPTIKYWWKMLMWITAQIKYYFSASSMTCTAMPYYILKKEKKAILLGNSSTWGSKSQIETQSLLPPTTQSFMSWSREKGWGPKFGDSDARRWGAAARSGIEVVPVPLPAWWYTLSLCWNGSLNLFVWISILEAWLRSIESWTLQ